MYTDVVGKTGELKREPDNTTGLFFMRQLWWPATAKYIGGNRGVAPCQSAPERERYLYRVGDETASFSAQHAGNFSEGPIAVVVEARV